MTLSRTRLLAPVTAAVAALACLAGTAAVDVATAPAAAAAQVLAPAVPAGVQERQVLDGFNAERARTGAAPVVLDPVLDRVAQDWADRLGQGSGLAHNPDLPRLLGEYSRWGEVVASADSPGPDTRGTLDGAMAVRTWLASPPHRAVLTDRRLTAVGVGLVHTSTTVGGRTVWRTYWVADFGGPRTGPLVRTLAGGDRSYAGVPVRGALLQRYAAAGAERGPLGLPTGFEVGPLAGGGWGQQFAGGSLYWRGGLGAHAVRGALRDAWAAQGWERGALGYPVAEEAALPGGFVQLFQGGVLVWSPRTGTQAVRGAILDRWNTTGGAAGSLGYPVVGDTALRGGALTHFQRGSVYWSPAGGARVVAGAVREAWAVQGWENGRLGYPVSEVRGTERGLRQDFQGGHVDVVDGRAGVVLG